MSLSRPKELPSLTQHQLEILRRFVRLEATVEDVKFSLQSVFQIEFGAQFRTSECHFRVPTPGVSVRRDDVIRALQEKRSGKLTEIDAVHWATMILHNEAFEIDGTDEDFIAEALNDLSFG